MIIYSNYSLKKFTSLFLDNVAKFIFEVTTYFEIYVLKYLFDYFNVDYLIIGKGSKVIFKDEYIEKPIIVISEKFEELYISNDKVVVSSGYDNKKLILKLLNYNLGGFHFLYPLPASIGGMVYMNASDKFTCINDYVESIMIINENNNIELLDNNACKFNYRDSIFKHRKCIIIYIKFKLKSIEKNVIIDEISKSLMYRINTQEICKSTCGSLFKNPSDNIKAYQLINGIKDDLESNDKVFLSSKHSNFLINNGASTTQILNFIKQIKKLVYQKYSILLSEEVNIL